MTAATSLRRSRFLRGTERLLIVVAALLLSFRVAIQDASAQQRDVIVPGSPLVDVSLIQPRVDTFQLSIVQADGTERMASRQIRSIEASDLGGTPTWTIAQSYASESGSSIDRSVIARRDLGSLRYTFSGDGAEHRFAFDGRRVTGTVRPPDGAARSVSYELPAISFSAVVDVEVVRALPLEVGLDVRIAAYNPPQPPRPEPTRIRVTGCERLSTAGGEVDAWVVSYEAGAAPTTLWIARDDRRFLRLRSKLGNGSTFWKLAIADLDYWRAERERQERDPSTHCP